MLRTLPLPHVCSCGENGPLYLKIDNSAPLFLQKWAGVFLTSPEDCNLWGMICLHGTWPPGSTPSIFSIQVSWAEPTGDSLQF